MKEFVLITDASYGLGYEMAKLLAAKNYNLILVARSGERLGLISASLSSSFKVEVHNIVKDLSDPAFAFDLYREVKARKFMVTHLVNNADFGDYGSFLETSLENEMNMINLNVNSLVVLTKLFAKEMALSKSGRIMNVASLLSFIPFPYYSIYSATKAFVLALSETIGAELEGTGVVVTTLCPGIVDTSFYTPEMRKTIAMKINKPVPVRDVAIVGVELLLNGKGKKIVGFNNWFISVMVRVTPNSIMKKIKKNLVSHKS